MVVAEVDDRGPTGKVGIPTTLGVINPNASGPFGHDLRIEGNDRGDDLFMA
jgi:hypothetical protein